MAGPSNGRGVRIKSGVVSPGSKLKQTLGPPEACETKDTTGKDNSHEEFGSESLGLSLARERNFEPWPFNPMLTYIWKVSGNLRI